jgi:hypothetical protein
VTITVAVSVVDSLVFASDSATTQMAAGPDGHVDTINIWNHGNKIFNLRKAWPVGAMTWGQAAMSNRSIPTLAKELRGRLAGQDAEHADWALDPKTYTIRQVAERTKEFFYSEHYQKDSHGPFGLAVGGYSAGSHEAELFLIRMQDNGCDEPEQLDCSQGLIFWEGMPEAVNRIVFGVSAALPQALTQLGVPEDQAEGYAQRIGQLTGVPLVFPGMPIGEAIDLAHFLADATIKFVRFTPGHQVVGGPIEIAAMTRHEGFKWITRKHHYPQELNVEGTLP